MRARRAVLYIPGSDEHKIGKAATLEVDSVCLDLEDGVAANRKGQARGIVAQALQTFDFGKTERLARINAVGTGLEADDLAAILPSHPDGIVVPKVSEAGHVRWVSEQIGKAEQAQSWAAGGIRLVAMIESARGIVNLREIASADSRLDALIFGAEDFAADLGAIRTREGWEVLYARGAIATYSAAFGLQAIDLLYLDFRNTDGLRDQALRGAQMGYAGMQVIHPNQIAAVQESFTPDDAAIAQAIRVLDTYRAHLQEGQGAFALDNRMVDLPIIKSAERVLERARAAGKRVGV